MVEHVVVAIGDAAAVEEGGVEEEGEVGGVVVEVTMITSVNSN